MTRARDLARFANANAISVDTNLNVGIGSTTPDAKLDVVGIISATSFYGDGSNLTNTGSTLSAASGTQRVVVTSQTTGTMTASATDGDLTFDASTNTLAIPSVIVGTAVTINSSGINAAAGIITASSFVGSGTNLTGLPSAGVGIQSASSVIGYGFTTLNFIGTGNTFSTNGTTVNVSIAGGGGATGGSTDEVFFENDQTITTNYTITAGKNALSAGPVAINTSVLVTIPSNSHWSIV